MFTFEKLNSVVGAASYGMSAGASVLYTVGSAANTVSNTRAADKKKVVRESKSLL